MRRIARTAPLLLALTLVASHCFAQTGKPEPVLETPPKMAPPTVAEYDPRAWKEFTSDAGRFSVLFPGVPTESTADGGEMSGGRITVHLFTLVTFAQYSASYSDLLPSLEITNVKAFFDGVRDGTIDALKCTLVSEEDDYRLGWPGRSYKVLLGDDLFLRVRAILVKGRVYQLSVAMKEPSAPEAVVKFRNDTATKFLDSFKLLPDEQGSARDAPRLGVPNNVNVDPALLEPSKASAEKPSAGEVDRMLKSLEEKGEPVAFTSCKDVSKCPPLDVEGATAEDAKRGIPAVKVIDKPQPAYPPIAKAARVQGSVVVQVVVDEEGKVIAAQAISGHPLLQAAAVKAARELRIAPVLLGTKPVKVSGVITYNFVLQ